MKKIKRIVAFVALFIGLIIVLFLVFSPIIARNYINKNGAELTGRKINIDELKLNYFTTTLQVIDFKMYEENGSDVFVGFDTLLVNLKPLRLLKHELHVEQFLVVNAGVEISQNDTLYNFTDLMEFYSGESTDTTEVVSDEGEAYRLNLNGLEIRSGSLMFTDLKIDHTASFHEISFLIPHIYWGANENSKADFNFQLENGGHFSSSFNIKPDDGDFSGSAKLEGLRLKALLPYVQQYVSVADVEGSVDAEMYFSGNQFNLELLRITGSSQVNEMKVTDNNGRVVLGAKKARTVLKEVKPFLYYTEIDSIELVEPYTYLALIDSMTNIEKMLKLSASSDDNSSSELVDDEAITAQVILNRFVVNNGLFDLSDQRLREEFNYELSEIEVDADTLSLQDDWLNVSATMKLNKRGDLKSQIGVNPSDPMRKINIEYVITDFQLPDMNIYSKHYAGLPILFGDMYYLGHTTITNMQLESKNELIIRNVEMGRKTGGLYDVPIKLALFILKDINGDIVLDIPVTGDLSDPHTHVGAIVWNTVKGFMTKIVASPFKAFGNLLGANPEDLEEITLNYGDTLLLGKQERNLDLLLKLEELKPELNIQMQYLNDKKLERTDVAAEYMQNLFYAEHDKKASNHRKAYLNYLEVASGKDSMLMQDYELILTPGELIDSVIQEREELRFKLVKDYFTVQNDSTSIQVLDYNADDVLNIGSRPRFNIRYKLAEDETSSSLMP